MNLFSSPSLIRIDKPFAMDHLWVVIEQRLIQSHPTIERPFDKDGFQDKIRENGSHEDGGHENRSYQEWEGVDKNQENEMVESIKILLLDQGIEGEKRLKNSLGMGEDEAWFPALIRPGCYWNNIKMSFDPAQKITRWAINGLEWLNMDVWWRAGVLEHKKWMFAFVSGSDFRLDWLSDEEAQAIQESKTSEDVLLAWGNREEWMQFMSLLRSTVESQDWKVIDEDLRSVEHRLSQWGQWVKRGEMSRYAYNKLAEEVWKEHGLSLEEWEQALYAQETMIDQIEYMKEMAFREIDLSKHGLDPSNDPQELLSGLSLKEVRRKKAEQSILEKKHQANSDPNPDSEFSMKKLLDWCDQKEESSES